jgi:hypothetical protein
MIKLIKLDRRMNGRYIFTHRVDFQLPANRRIATLHRARTWLWEQFGPSAELDCISQLALTQSTPDWAWDTANGHCRIFLKGSALTQFLLVKERFEL